MWKKILNFFNRKKNQNPVSIDKIKLDNEVLRDRVKQLEAQVKTLERALDKALAN